jgi:hypothetical protein
MKAKVINEGSSICFEVDYLLGPRVVVREVAVDYYRNTGFAPLVKSVGTGVSELVQIGDGAAQSGTGNAVQGNVAQWKTATVSGSNVNPVPSIALPDEVSGTPPFTLRYDKSFLTFFGAAGLTVGVSMTHTVSTSVLTAAANHGLANGDVVWLTGAGIPTGLLAGRMYYVIGATATTFQLAATLGGAALTVSTSGSFTVQQLAAVAEFPMDLNPTWCNEATELVV